MQMHHGRMLMMRRSSSPQLLFLLLLPFSTIQLGGSSILNTGNAYDDAHGFLADWAMMMRSGADGLDKLKFLSNGAFLSKKSAGVAALLASLASMAFEPNSDQLKAIKFMHRTIIDEFAELDRNLDNRMNVWQLTQIMGNYQERIILDLADLESKLKMALDPEIWESANAPSAPLRRVFTKRCHGDDSPIAMLRYLSIRFHKNCFMRTERELSVHADALQLFHDFEARLHPDLAFSVNNSMDYHYWKMDAINRLTDLQWEKGEEELGRLRNAIFGATQAAVGNDSKHGDAPRHQSNGGGALLDALPDNIRAVQLVEMLQKLVDAIPIVREDQSCMPQKVINKYQHRRRPIYDMATMLHTHIGKIEFLAIICSNVSNEGNEQGMHGYLEEMSTELEDLVAKLQNWVTNELERFWPIPMLQYGRGDIAELIGGHRQDVTDGYQYQPVAHGLYLSMNGRGLAKYRYQILVTEGNDGHEYFHAECDRTRSCHLETAYKGMNIVYTRYNVEDGEHWLERMKKSAAWIEKERANITAIIAANYKSDDPALIMSEINKTTGGALTDGRFYRNHILVHKSTVWGKNCVINYGIAADHGTAGDHQQLFGYETVGYYADPFWRYAERFSLFSLL